VFTYTFDAVGNRLTQTTITNSIAYTCDIANRLTNVAGQAYTWDANGNLLSDGAMSYAYDSANRPITITQGANTYLFGYDGMGNRRRQLVNGVPTTYTLDLNASLVQVLADSGGNS
jgi:YD repeat-containing protein